MSALLTSALRYGHELERMAVRVAKIGGAVL
jgi:hypothetical protein